MCVDPLIYVYGYFCVCMYGGGLSRFRQLLHSSGRLFCVATVRCGKTLVIHDNRVRRRCIKILLFVYVVSESRIKHFFPLLTGASKIRTSVEVDQAAFEGERRSYSW